jgi:ribonuclease P protein component
MERRRRIGRAEELRRVRQQGRCWSADVLVLCALATGAAVTRFAFVVSKRQGGAVVRNRVKRRLREAARRLAPSLPAGYDIVMIARGPIASRGSDELGATIAGLLQRARLRPVVSTRATPAAPRPGEAAPATGGPTA